MMSKVLFELGFVRDYFCQRAGGAAPCNEVTARTGHRSPLSTVFSEIITLAEDNNERTVSANEALHITYHIL